MIKINDSKSVIEKIKSLYNKDVTVTQNIGRNKFVSFVGKVTGVYQALFTVSPNSEFNGKTSFSYSEVMCGKVQINVK